MEKIFVLAERHMPLPQKRLSDVHCGICLVLRSINSEYHQPAAICSKSQAHLVGPHPEAGRDSSVAEAEVEVEAERIYQSSDALLMDSLEHMVSCWFRGLVAVHLRYEMDVFISGGVGLDALTLRHMLHERPFPA